MNVLFYREDAGRHWHSVLAGRLAACGHRVGVFDVGEAVWHDWRSGSLRQLLRLEQKMSGGGRVWLCDPFAPAERRAFDPGMSVRDCDIVIRVYPRGRLSQHSGQRELVPTFDGVEGEAAFWNALLDGRAPVLGVFDSATGLTTTLAVPALEAPHRLSESAESVLTHLVAGLERAIGAITAGQPIPQFATVPTPASAVPTTRRSPFSTSDSALPALARHIGNTASAKCDALLQRSPTWQVAWRRTPQRTISGNDFNADLYHRLTDDGRRFFADPFLFIHEGVTHVFVEELPYETGKGVISHFIIDADGGTGTPHIVLEEPHHLSYPHVFEHDGQIWMMPESSTAGRLDLYRAQRFPDRWEHHRTLIDAPLHDVTFHAEPDRLWLFAGSTLPGAATWDTLSLFWADQLEGHWQAHPMNPVLVDARAARPAGGLFMHAGHLWRPAQDCTRGYGGALTLNRITRLDIEGFTQELVTTLSAGSPDSAQGPHTVNFAGGIEVVNFFQRRGMT